MLATQKNFSRLLAPFLRERRLVKDTETTGLNPWRGDRIVGLSLAIPSLRHVVYFPIRHNVGENITLTQYREITNLLSDQRRIFTGWNIKFDFEMAMQDGVTFPAALEDIMLACHHLNENDKPFELKRWAAKWIDPDAATAEDALLKRLRQECKAQGIKTPSTELKKYIRLLDPGEVEEYACKDVIYPEQLRTLAIPALKRWKTYRLWRESNQYLRETMWMEVRGMQLDVPVLERYSAEAKRKYKKAEKRLFVAAGHEINARSPKQLCQFLGTTSSAKEIVEELGTPEAEALLTYRAWNKVDTDYYEKWLRFMDDEEVLHPNLLLHGTGTGRQSAREPPLHGTPRYRKEYKVKDVIQARPGYVIVSADYNQMELRIAASLANETKMIDVFRAGEDIHQSVADLLHTSRDNGKSINFMMLYGGGPGKLARMAKIPLEEAEQHIRNYRSIYWRLRKTAKWYATVAESQGYIRLWTGRVRHFNHPIFANPKDAFNSAVQGGGAEMLRIAICRMGPRLRKRDAWILLQIHDQVLVEVPLHRLRRCCKIIREEMENFPRWRVPPKVDFKTGPRWGQLEKWAA